MFKFDFYVKEIQQGRMRRTATSDRTVWLEFDDDNLEDNFFHAGIEVTNKKGAVVVSIGEYYN